MKHLALISALILAGCGCAGCHSDKGGDRPPPTPTIPVVVAPSVSMDPTAWEIGPVDYPGGNPSKGTPLHPSLHPEGWSLEIPRPPGSAHYVTRSTGPLTGFKQIVMRFRVETENGAEIVPRDRPELTGMLTMYFQRAGDCWTAACEAYRWYATFAAVRPLIRGDYVAIVPLDGNWSAVLNSTKEKNTTEFYTALANASRVGFVLGGGNGVGHGVHATGPARIVVKSFEVQ